MIEQAMYENNYKSITINPKDRQCLEDRLEPIVHPMAPENEANNDDGDQTQKKTEHIKSQLLPHHSYHLITNAKEYNSTRVNVTSPMFIGKGPDVKPCLATRIAPRINCPSWKCHKIIIERTATPIRRATELSNVFLGLMHVVEGVSPKLLGVGSCLC